MQRPPLITNSDADIIPLDDFPLAWRFVSNRHGRWASKELGRLQPLSPVSSSRAHSAVLAIRANLGPPLVAFRTDDTPAEVSRRLHELPPDGNERIVLSWDEGTALATDYETFASRWDDFCYSASDDVTVLPMRGAWIIQYHHYDMFQFRTGVSAA